ncbi:MAG: STAS domain-containing protein [Chitinivibrionales bacterium]|nr:STAS domain-containing protein [Chitinivibrionales bacterium]
MDSMSLSVREEGTVAIVVITGNILQDNVSLFQIRLNELIENKKNNIVLDMHGSSYISSMGLAVIVDAKVRLEKVKGDIKLACANNLIKNLLETTRLIEKIKLFTTVEEAVASFS